jgi:hypothetical protein
MCTGKNCSLTNIAGSSLARIVCASSFLSNTVNMSAGSHQRFYAAPFAKMLPAAMESDAAASSFLPAVPVHLQMQPPTLHSHYQAQLRQRNGQQQQQLQQQQQQQHWPPFEGVNAQGTAPTSYQAQQHSAFLSTFPPPQQHQLHERTSGHQQLPVGYELPPGYAQAHGSQDSHVPSLPGSSQLTFQQHRLQHYPGFPALAGSAPHAPPQLAAPKLGGCRQVPLLSNFTSLTQLWERLAVRDPTTNGPSMVQLESTHGRAWRAESDRQRWKEYKDFYQAVQGVVGAAGRVQTALDVVKELEVMRVGTGPKVKHPVAAFVKKIKAHIKELHARA